MAECRQFIDFADRIPDRSLLLDICRKIRCIIWPGPVFYMYYRCSRSVCARVPDLLICLSAQRRKPQPMHAVSHQCLDFGGRAVYAGDGFCFSGVLKKTAKERYNEVKKEYESEIWKCEKRRLNRISGIQRTEWEQSGGMIMPTGGRQCFAFVRLTRLRPGGQPSHGKIAVPPEIWLPKHQQTARRQGIIFTWTASRSPWSCTVLRRDGIISSMTISEHRRRL